MLADGIPKKAYKESLVDSKRNVITKEGERVEGYSAGDRRVFQAHAVFASISPQNFAASIGNGESGML